jgi:hypothetical protein
MQNNFGTPSTHSPIRVLVEKLAELNISQATFSEIASIGRNQISRWSSGQSSLPEEEFKRLQELINDLAWLQMKFHPFRIDLSDPEHAKEIIRKVRNGRLWVKVFDSDPENRMSPLSVQEKKETAEKLDTAVSTALSEFPSGVRGLTISQ